MSTKDYSQREIIKTSAIDLPVGGSSRIVCPYCNASHEQSMRIHRHDVGIYARCYRAKCGKKVFINSLPSVQARPERREFTPRYFTGALIDPPGEVLHYLHDVYELLPDEIKYFGIKYCEERNALYMPIRDIRGYEIGGQTKALGNTKYPKAITYFHNDAVKCHFALPIDGHVGDTIVVVEDQLSATKLSRLMPACALLSHSMTPDVANLLATNFKTMIVMLDPDATKAALKLKHQYSLLFRNFFVVVLCADPKDTSFQELNEKLGNFLSK